jgi:glycosyltransferase involved in cell wall biosynthesis
MIKTASRTERKSEPLVSVIIPAYNCERYITTTIKSVLNQTFSDLEIIVVDDGSTDHTRDIVASYGPPVQLICQPNSGVCVARNHGIRQAAGQYVCLMDHDDYWFPDKLELQVEAMKSHPDAGIIYASFIPWNPNEDGVFPEPTSFNLNTYPDGIDNGFSGWIYHQFLLDCWMLTSTAMFRREVFEKCGNFNETLPYSEDWDLWLRISQEYPFVKLNRPSTLYRQHPQQGNRVVRDIDYRTTLLSKAVKQWGYCSRDGRCLPAGQFRRQLAEYHAVYAYRHIRAGNMSKGLYALAKAWLTYPVKIKFLVIILATLLGWRPKW